MASVQVNLTTPDACDSADTQLFTDILQPEFIDATVQYLNILWTLLIDFSVV